MGKERSNINLQYDRQYENQEGQNEWQSAENNIDRQWQQDFWLTQFQLEKQQQELMFEKENQRWIDQFNMQNEYNDPKKQVQRLLSAGINPAAYYQAINGGNSSASPSGSSGAGSPNPSGGSSHGVSPLGLQSPNGVSSDAMMFSSIAQLADSVSKIGESVVGGYETVSKLQPTIDNMVSDTNLKQEQAAITAIQKSIQAAYGKDAAAADIWNKVASSYSLVAQGDLAGAQKLYNEALIDLTNQEKFQKNESFPTVLSNMRKYGNYLDSQVLANKAGAAASYASAEASKASARLSDSLAETENALREGKVTALDLSNKLADVQRQLANRENLRDAATHQDKIIAIINQCEREGYVTEAAAAGARKAVTDANWSGVEHFVGCASQALSSVSQLGGVYNGYIGNVVGAQRNAIQERFVEYYGRSNGVDY